MVCYGVIINKQTKVVLLNQKLKKLLEEKT